MKFQTRVSSNMGFVQTKMAAYIALDIVLFFFESKNMW